MGALALATAGGIAGQAQAAWFVRPYVQQGARVVDGYQKNGDTSAGVNFGSEFQSEVDLASGTVRTFVEVTGPDSGGSGFGQALGVFGDRMTFNGAGGEQVDVSFDFDGMITAPARDPQLNSLMQIGVSASLWVYDAAAGATYQNFTSRGGALVSQSLSLNYSNPTDDLNAFVQRSLSGSFTIGTDGRAAYDVFVVLATFVSMNSNPGTVTMDFMNTGTFGVATAPGVTFTSDSGALLGSGQTGAIPEPGTWALMIGGFGIAGSMLRRRRTVLAA